MDAQYFTSFIDQHFDIMLERSGEGLNRLWLQDGDPSQNSKSACDAMFCCQAKLLRSAHTMGLVARIELSLVNLQLSTRAHPLFQ